MERGERTDCDIIVVGSGNAALDQRYDLLMIEKSSPDLAGGYSKYTAGAMRFVYNGNDDLLTLPADRAGARLADTEFGSYTAERGARRLSARAVILACGGFEASAAMRTRCIGQGTRGLELPKSN